MNDGFNLMRLAGSVVLAALIAGCGVRGPLEVPARTAEPVGQTGMPGSAQPDGQAAAMTPEESARRAAEPPPPGVYWSPQAAGSTAFPESAAGVARRPANTPGTTPRPTPAGVITNSTFLDPLL